MQSPRTCKLVVLGDSGVGKTTLIHSYVSNEFCADFKSTIGADFSSKTMEVNGVSVELQIWDTAGEERFHSVGSAFYRGADACLLVYDLTQKETFDRLDFWKNDIVQKSSITSPEDFPFVIFGNKSDLIDQQQIDPEFASGWAEQNKRPHFTVSAKTSENLQEGFQTIVQLFLNNASRTIEAVPAITLHPEESTPQKKSCCK